MVLICTEGFGFHPDNGAVGPAGTMGLSAAPPPVPTIAAVLLVGLSDDNFPGFSGGLGAPTGFSCEGEGNVGLSLSLLMPGVLLNVDWEGCMKLEESLDTTGLGS